MNFTSTNPAIRILFSLTLLFYATAVALSMFHAPDPVTNHAWGAFEGVFGALLLMLKADNSHSTPPLVPPAGPAQSK